MGEIRGSAPEFAPRRVLAATPADPQCTYVANSLADAGWESVLYRVGRRSDPSGRADMGAAEHPRLTLTHRGNFAVHRDDAGRRRAGRLAPGRSWLVPPGEALRYDWSGAGSAPREISILVLPRRMLDDAAEQLGNRLRARAVRWEGIRLADDAVVSAVMLGMRRAVAAGVEDLYAQTASTFLVQHLLVTYGMGTSSPARVGREDARIREVIDYLYDNLHLPITLADMAGVARLSSYHFLRVFHDATGQTPRRYLNGLRIDAACRQLAEPELSISDIASLCGFGTPSHFAATFRRAVGVSPSEYRRELFAR